MYNSRELEDSHRRTRHFYESMLEDCKLQTSTQENPRSNPLTRKASIKRHLDCAELGK